MDVKKYISKEEFDVNDLIDIMKILRSDEGCPWDAEQTHKSIRNNFIEECYEAVEAIDDEDFELLKEELGDVLLQVVFHSEMASEKEIFGFDEVVSEVCKKLVVRHPHIFSDTNVNGVDDVLTNWESIKQATKGRKTLKQSLEGVSKALPSLMKYQKIYKKLSKSQKKIDKTIDNLEKSDKIDIEYVGAELARLVALAEENNINAEEALSLYSDKIINDL